MAVNALMVSSGQACADPAQERRVVLPRQGRVEPRHHVDLGDPERPAREDLLDRLVERHRVAGGRGLPLLARERAELAGGDADVGRVQVDVAVVEGEVAVARLAHVVRERPQRGEVRRLEEAERVGVGDAAAGEHLVPDRAEAVALERAVREVGDHLRVLHRLGGSASAAAERAHPLPALHEVVRQAEPVEHARDDGVHELRRWSAAPSRRTARRASRTRPPR